MLDLKPAGIFLKIVPSLIIATAILGGLTSNVKAQSIVPSIDPSLIPDDNSFMTDKNESQKFFEEGIEMCEREIEWLTMGSLEFSDSILKISEQPRIQENFSPGENNLELDEQ